MKSFIHTTISVLVICLFVSGCYFGPSRPILLPYDSINSNRLSFDFETPKIKYAIDTFQIQTLRVASIKLNHKLSKQDAIEISTNSIAYEHRFLSKENFEFGSITKLGGGSEGDILEGIEDHSSLFCFISLVQINWMPPFQKHVWLGAGLEYDIRSYSYRYSKHDTAQGKKTINILERDIFFVESVMLNFKKAVLYASVYSAPLLEKPVYEIERLDDKGNETGISKRRRSDFTYRYGVSYKF